MTNTKADAAIDSHLAIPMGPLRLRTILIGLRFEIQTEGRGRLTAKAPKCSTILRKEFGLSGKREKLYAQFEALLASRGLL